MQKQRTSPGGWIVRIFTVTLTVLLLLVLLAYGVMWILVNGPSPTARRLFVLSVKETSAGGFLADIYLNEDEISEILSASVEVDTPEMDLGLIRLPDKETTAPSTPETEVPSQTGREDSDTTAPVTEATSGETTAATLPPEEDDGIEVLDIEGQTFHGKMLVISDPSRVFVGVPDSYGEGSYGLTVAAMIEKYDCVAGTNAGGFYDPNGQGTGGIPEGIVIYEGDLLWGELGTSYNLAGIDRDGILHVGRMTAKHALDIGVQYAASYGPALVVNGQAVGGKYGLGGGLNPRTAIGQRADGAILLLVINGRTIDSLGATLDDVAAVMLEHGAVNATNLDGGSSSIMLMDGEYLTNSAYIFGERVVATAILVRK